MGGEDLGGCERVGLGWEGRGGDERNAGGEAIADIWDSKTVTHVQGYSILLAMKSVGPCRRLRIGRGSRDILRHTHKV